MFLEPSSVRTYLTGRSVLISWVSITVIHNFVNEKEPLLTESQSNLSKILNKVDNILW
jgi:hypothetical protein